MKPLERYIYILRHGETEYGREKRYLGHTNCKLSENGLEDAKKLYCVFKNLEIENIYSSDLERCTNTINIVFPERKVVLLKALREINMGEWEGLTFEEIKIKKPEEFKKRGEKIAFFAPPKGESFNQCQQRAVKALDEIVKSTNKNVVICTHAGFIRALLCRLLNKDLDYMFNIKLDYGCINILKFEEDNISVEAINIKNL